MCAALSHMHSCGGHACQGAVFPCQHFVHFGVFPVCRPHTSHFWCVCLQQPGQDALSAAPTPNVITRAMVAKHPQFASEFQHAEHLGGYADEHEIGGVRDNGRFRNHLGVWDIASRDNPVLLQSFVDPEGHTGILDTSLESALDWDAAQCMEYN